jgi:hypothetical protein
MSADADVNSLLPGQPADPVQYLPSKREVLSSNPSMAKKTKFKKTKWEYLNSHIKIKSSYSHTCELVTHTCNPSYSGGRDQEDRGSKPSQANSSRGPSQNRAGRVA